MANRLMKGHFQTEDYIKASGLSYALFRNVLYLDAIPLFVGPNVFDTGIYLPAGQGKVSFALRSEMGEAMATVLAADNTTGKVYTLTNSTSYSFDDVAAVLTDISGKQVRYIPAEQPAFEQQLKAREVPEMAIQRIIGFLTDIKNGQEDEVSSDLEKLLGRKPATLHEGLKTIYTL